MTAGKELVLLLPAKDEAENLPSLLRKAWEAGFAKVVVYDDGSVDSTPTVAKEGGAEVLSHPQGLNMGLAHALRALLEWASTHLEDSSVAVLMDADGTMDPRQAPEALERMREAGASIGVGSRYLPGSAVTGLPLARRLYSLGARGLYHLFHPIPGVRDYTSGYRLYTARFLRRYREAFPFWFRSPGFTAQTELLIRASWMGERAVEFPMRLAYGEKRGGSKMRVVRTTKEYLLLALTLRRERESFRAFPPPSWEEI